MKLSTKMKVLAVTLAALSLSAEAQLIHGNTFPFWNVTGDLTVGGTATFTSITATSGVTFSGSSINILGSSGATSAASGYIGEVISQTVSSTSAITCAASGVAQSFTAITLSPGEWDVSITCNFLGTSWVGTRQLCSLSSTADIAGTLPGGNGIGPGGHSSITFASQTLPDLTNTVQVPTVRVMNTSTKTVYATNLANYSAGSCVAFGTINARRVR